MYASGYEIQTKSLRKKNRKVSLIFILHTDERVYATRLSIDLFPLLRATRGDPSPYGHMRSASERRDDDIHGSTFNFRFCSKTTYPSPREIQ